MDNLTNACSESRLPVISLKKDRGKPSVLLTSSPLFRIKIRKTCINRQTSSKDYLMPKFNRLFKSDISPVREKLDSNREEEETEILGVLNQLK